MIGLLKKRRKRDDFSVYNKVTKFQSLIIRSLAEINDVPENRWYRVNDWEPPNYILWKRPPLNKLWGRGWLNLFEQEKVVGITQNRQDHFLILGHKQDFEMFLEPEPENKYDKNALKVMCKATVQGKKITNQIGYISKGTAKKLKNRKDLIAFPHSAYLPCQGKSLVLKIRILGR